MPQGVDTLLIAQAIAVPEIAYFAAALGTAGSLAGSLVLYVLARRAGRPILERRMSEDGVRKLGGIVGRWGPTALIPVTMIPLPLPMKPVVLAAGVFQMPLAAFCSAVAFARVARYFGLVFLARQYGSDALALAVEHAHLALLACILLCIALFAIHTLSKRWLDA